STGLARIVKVRLRRLAKHQSTMPSDSAQREATGLDKHVDQVRASSKSRPKTGLSGGESEANRIKFPPKTAYLRSLGGKCCTRKFFRRSGGRARTRTVDLLRVKNRIQ